MKFIYFVLVVFCFQNTACTTSNESSSALTEVNNTKPRVDKQGNILDAHDGIILQDGNTFYLYGTAYGRTTGFTRANKYVCYSSKNLKDWDFEGDIMPESPSGIYYRPRVIFNEKLNKYILWYNWYPQLWDGRFGVAMSDKPIGPFEIVNTDVKVANSHLGVGDFGLFKDDDGTAYIVYNTIQGHKNSVEKLNSDYLNSSMENGGFIAERCEAGSIFKREGKYYLLTDFTCCFCTQGSGARVYVSDNPLSGYEFKGNINRYFGENAPILQDGDMSPNLYYTIKSENDNKGAKELILVFDGQTKIDKLDIWQFTGNRWGMCGDTLASETHTPIVKPKFNLYAKKHDSWETIETKVDYNEIALRNVISMRFKKQTIRELKVEIANYNTNNGLFVNEVEVFFQNKPSNTTHKTYVCNKGTYGTPIIPAQQSDVMTIKRNGENAYIWIGDLWGSASDNIKGHDYMYWSKPLEFSENGNILSLEWTDEWSLDL
ncbi:MAG: family 43 glycosylhydrolase [Bacteroidales bacterium]